MDQIPTDISGKQVIAVLLREGITRIDRSSRCSRKVTSHNLSGGIQFTDSLQAIFPVTLLAQPGSLHSPLLRLGQRKHPGGRTAVVGDILGDGWNCQQRRFYQVLHGHDHMSDMDCVLRDEAIPPFIESHTKLGRPGGRFGQPSIWLEAKVCPTH